MIELPEDDWEALSQPEKGQDPAERLSSTRGTMHVPTLPPIQGVPDPEGHGTVETVPLLTRHEPV
ncbi:Hypothetical protein FKW44_016837 [Caligus rogercresseyi]|uniref:Uncharacterized protein n=1 Tax=Caligus rogercresseyi TaxID=217165 RepID=A0A7T8K1N8_CALRO|nr:Hypothetical protein FKW44_016837 [Caligus rogercresseyi]